MRSKKAQTKGKTSLPHGRGSVGEGRALVGEGRALTGVCAAAVLVVFLWAYSPVMHTGFLFDDLKQIFALSSGSSSLWTWVKTPIRPMLMATYWFNNQLSRDTYSYHVINLLIHVLAATL